MSKPRGEPGRVAGVLPIVALMLFILMAASPGFAGPPFLTDDPDPVPWHHYEAYLFGTVDRGTAGSFSVVPAFELNVGAAPGLQLHAIVPAAYATPQKEYGIGDIELGVKYRLVKEGKWRPEIGVFPLVELPAGSSRRGLGNGQTWTRLPLWLQKSWGPWTSYGGAGYQLNGAAEKKDSLFAGWLLQRQLNKRLTLGTEVYHQEAQTVGARQTTFLDGGGYFNFRKDLNLLFMLGHTVTGERHTTGYLGLYYTWGKDYPVS